MNGEISWQDLLAVIGEKQVRIEMLQGELQRALAEIERLQTILDLTADKDTPPEADA